MFCAATLLMGSSMAFTQQYRFAAAESAPPERLSQAVSYVLVGSLGAAIVNRSSRWLRAGWCRVRSTQDRHRGRGVVAATIVVLSRVQVNLRRCQPRPRGRSATRTVRDSALRRAVFAGPCAYAVMSFVMTAAPISMHNFDHHNVEATTWVIQSHVLAMYLPSLFTGHVIARFGERKVMIWGGVILSSCAVVSLFGHQFMHYWLGLVALGLGWNLLFVAGTTLLARSVDPASRHRAQALNDSCVRLAGLRLAPAGLAVQQIGWQALNLVTLPLLAAMIFTAFACARRRQQCPLR